MKNLILLFSLFISIGLFSSDLLEQQIEVQDPYFDANLRKNNSISFGGGSTLINNDFDNPDYENSIQLGYKRFFGDYVNIGVNAKKFGIKDYEFKTIGYLSFDLNLEFYMLPESKVSPFIYAGGGAITSNDFKEVNNKVQGGIGLEYLFADSFAIFANAEANYLLNQEDFTLIPELSDNSIYYNATDRWIAFLFWIKKSSKYKNSFT